MKMHSPLAWLCCSVLLGVVGASLQQAANLRLEVEPRYTHVQKKEPVTLTCTLSDDHGESVPIAGCGIKNFYQRDDAKMIVKDTIPVNNTNTAVGSVKTNYFRDFQKGKCTLEVTFLEEQVYIIGCRLRPADGGAWLYGSMMVNVNDISPMLYELQPSGVLVSLRGREVALVSLAEGQVDECKFIIPQYDNQIILNSSYTSENTTQYRVWLEGRRCGVHLLGVESEDSGFVINLSFSPRFGRAGNFVEYIVAAPPASPPRLSVNTTDATFHAGDMLHAICVVDESRPVSNITWLLGGEVIRENNWNEAPVESNWRWNHKPQIIMQRLSRRLTLQDDGKELKCRAEHLALPSGTLDSNSHIVRLDLSMQQKANLRLDVEPRYIHVEKKTAFTVTCTLRDDNGESVPLAGCGFRNFESDDDAVWDMGTDTTIINTTNTGPESWRTKNLRGLASGKCITRLSFPRTKIYILGCRARPAIGGAWLYGATMVDVDNFSCMQYGLQPSEVLVSLPGHDVAFVGQAQRQVDMCNFNIPPYNNQISLNSSYTSKNTTEYRAWLKGRQCGMTLLSVQPKDSGFVMSFGAAFDSFSGDFVEHIVATPPLSPPRLTVNTTDATFQAGDILQAICVVDESRPVSNITWLLGGEVVRENNWNEEPAESTWRWNYEPQGIIQRLSRRLTQQDDSKELRCRAAHLALPSGTLDSNLHIIRFGANPPHGA